MYAGPDEGWAKWVDHQLREACYTTELDVWDWAAGINIVSALQRALSRARRMVALLSPDYFDPQGNRAVLGAFRKPLLKQLFDERRQIKIFDFS